MNLFQGELRGCLQINQSTFIKFYQPETGRQRRAAASFACPPEDHEFIHFSTEEQVDRTIEKFWADEPEFVILKIDSSKLEGNLIFEPNPGRVNKYWHLYDGTIPFEAVVEARLIFGGQSDNHGALQS